ncbi:hypothetical protein HanRHA438_Chr09g0378031 [Helianthus annuus]|nr:hypothetical protein HanRHA438_Chr09g0378031 [Helianthus annuus]
MRNASIWPIFSKGQNPCGMRPFGSLFQESQNPCGMRPFGSLFSKGQNPCGMRPFGSLFQRANNHTARIHLAHFIFTNFNAMHRNHNSHKSRIPPRRSTQLEGTLDWGDLKRYGPNSLPTWQGPHHFLCTQGIHVTRTF